MQLTFNVQHEHYKHPYSASVSETDPKPLGDLHQTRARFVLELVSSNQVHMASQDVTRGWQHCRAFSFCPGFVRGEHLQDV